MHRSYQVRLKTTKRQAETLTALLLQLCELYNICLEQRRAKLKLGLWSCEKRIIKAVRKRRLYAFLLIAALLAWGADTKTFAPPPAGHAKTYPAHESHDDEKVSIAIDPFDMPDKAKIFSINYQEKNFLPIRLIISNDSDDYLMLNDLKIQYITLHREKIEPATAEDIYRRVIRLKRNPGTGVPSPIPLPRNKSPVTKDGKIALQELDQAQFVPHPVDPHSIRSGFLFFDITGIDPPEAGAHVYISGLKVGGKELFYFDIAMEKYLSYQPGK